MRELFETTEISIAQYKRDFLPNFSNAQNAWKSREGIIFRLAQNGRIGYGEAAPLAGHSLDTLAGIETYLFSRTKSAIFSDWMQQGQGHGLGHAQAPEPTQPAPIRMALDSALQEIQFDPDAIILSPVANNALVPLMPAEQGFAWIQQQWNAGFRCFKFKLSLELAPQVFELCLFLKSIATERFQIRLDSNHSFTSDTIVPVAAQFQTFPIEYWEDPLPLADLWSWKYFKKESPFPIAVDSALVSLEYLDSALAENLADVYILKPSVIGGLNRTESAISKITAAKKKFSVTSLLETEIGIRAILILLGKLPASPRAQGLSSGCLFTENHFPVGAAILPSYQRSQSEQTWLGDLSWKTLA